MPVTRSDVLHTLTYFLENKFSQEKIYEWAWSQVAAKDYDFIAQNDPLLKEALEALIAINHSGTDYTPTREDMEYYQRCLRGETSFEPLKIRLEKRRKELQQQRLKHLKEKENYLRLAGIYVKLFAFCSLGINLLSVIRPQMFNPDNASRTSAFWDALPNFIYAGILLAPSRIWGRGWRQWTACAVSILGAIFYVYITFAIILKLELHLLFMLVLAPFGILPALLAVWLLWEDRKKRG